MTEQKPSKSALKRQQAELRQLGASLIDLDDSTLDGLGLDESLLDAVRDAKRIRSHEALRRQKQLIGKRMNAEDADRIRAMLAEAGRADALEKRRFALAERWRDRIVTEGTEAARAFAAEHGAPGDELLQVSAALERAGSDNDEKRLKRQLFKIIHATLASG